MSGRTTIFECCGREIPGFLPVTIPQFCAYFTEVTSGGKMWIKEISREKWLDKPPREGKDDAGAEKDLADPGTFKGIRKNTRV